LPDRGGQTEGRHDLTEVVIDPRQAIKDALGDHDGGSRKERQRAQPGLAEHVVEGLKVVSRLRYDPQERVERRVLSSLDHSTTSP
jgi:hypothetical protein